MYEVPKVPRVMLVGLSDPKKPKEEMFLDFEEVESLVHSFGGIVCAALVQNMTRGDYGTFIGYGKVDEAVKMIEDNKIDIVVINETIKPQQIHRLFLAFQKVNPNIFVWDRISLILEIFSKHAKTASAKLQIKFAKMRQMGPRIYGMGMELSGQGGGIGTRGLGETNTQLMVRHWRAQKAQVQKELAEISKKKTDQILHRKKGGMPTISLVGYTNAGKTTLFNALTGSKDLTENRLFATLESTVNKFYIKSLGREVFISDTIGFIKNLPPDLIDAFKSTLLEALNADLILNIIDSTDSRLYEKIATVEQILHELGIDKKKIVYVFNKIEDSPYERANLADQYREFSPQFISAKTGEGMEDLMKFFTERLSAF